MAFRVVYRVGPGGPAEPYAAAQEFGTHKMAAQPYMRPAFEANKHKIEAEIERVVGLVIAANRVR